MRVKSRKPPAENLMTSDLSVVLEIGRGADDGVGDEMRQMRGDGEHLVVMRRRPWSTTCMPAASHSAVTRASAAGVAVRQRRQDAPAVVEQLGEAGLGAGMLGAGDGMPGHEMHARRHERLRGRGSTASLTEPTSVTMAPGVEMRRDAPADLGIGRERRAR